ncbi:MULTISPECIES: hypothetical protein [unclassified Neisseria]|uniref:hypothetical protein n=1 Tax=unclassified Neisseria TaxID=2623750 RepID=UPI00107274F8|nr:MULTISPECIES: hypothetical protein [unclassified Neisseria]MBF0804040.1 hypothetical protein [Neisseria sp. 19428wB4_WF04]TFU43243.1 hypothetical protein E4T99_06670 [Neisseria sp. WF04]
MTPNKLKPENLLPEPVRPEAWECCGSDCGDACIQTVYWHQKAAYDAQQQQWQAQLAEEAAEKAGGGDKAV